MMLRALYIAALALTLAACNQDQTAATPPPPATLNSGAMGLFCGMNVLEHPGPKGQIITASRIDPFWFTSVRDTVAFTLMPDQPRDIRAIYVSDMGAAPSWEQPGATNWIDARKAFFVIESRRQSGMETDEAVPFGNRAAAEAFVADHGGRVVGFEQIPSAYVLGGEPPAHSEHDPGAHDPARTRTN
ncbi:MAG: nitrous oxide reductase accessory protein NosL [Xanthobacteraceae bacterium]|nr:nitrous oxide reductase accessory protein NosL [Xanthobacteraceae bacterium]